MVINDFYFDNFILTFIKIIKFYTLNTAFFDFTVYNISDTENFYQWVTGDNQRHILIGFLDEQQEMLEIFLHKIIGSAKLDLEKDCLILRGHSASVSIPTFAQMKSFHKIEKAVLFGLTGKDLGLNIETHLYIPFAFNNCQFMFADKLSSIENSVELKKALWHGLQTLFL